MIRLYLMNFDYFSQDEFSTLDAAIAAAKKGCFQTSFWRDGVLLGSWCPIGGFRAHKERN